MESYQTIAGFSDIKIEFRTKTGATKLLSDLQLWFSFADDVLYAHDYEEHKKSIVLAIYNSKARSWTVYLKNGSYGKKLVEDIINTKQFDKIEKSIIELYKSHGFV